MGKLFMRGLAIALSVVFLAGMAFGQADSGGPAKNVILMIGDGMGFNTAQLGILGNSAVADLFNGGFTVSLGVTTYSITSTTPTSNHNPAGYDPNRYWNGGAAGRQAPVTGQGVQTTDSAEAITAMMTGQKTSAGLNWNNAANRPMDDHIALDVAKGLGMKIGAVSTVPASHATPGGVGAHNADRNQYVAIFDEMIGNLDLVFGAGARNLGAQQITSTYLVGSNTWSTLTSANPVIKGTSYEMLRTKADFQAYANETKDWANSGKDKVVGIFNASDSRYDTLRVQGATAYNALPSLTDMSLASLNILDSMSGDNGFFVMLEGGGIDWANHVGPSLVQANVLAEVNDFMSAVLAVYQWITDNNMWEDTLLIVTADHETGDIWGKAGFGNVPTSTTDFAGNYTSHTNALVPLWAAGAGSDLFVDYIYGQDTRAASTWNGVAGFGEWDGSYIDNINIYDVMFAAMNREPLPPLPPDPPEPPLPPEPSPTPEPTTLLLLTAGCALLGLGRKKFLKSDAC
ncbi:MAG: alkaline phosphatase [Planctomycetaceae bacterium]|nr:alkaline phosphatase [Planctomycetaceae bacterium]